MQELNELNVNKQHISDENPAKETVNASRISFKDDMTRLQRELNQCEYTRRKLCEKLDMECNRSMALVPIIGRLDSQIRHLEDTNEFLTMRMGQYRDALNDIRRACEEVLRQYAGTRKCNELQFFAHSISLIVDRF